MKLLCRLLVLAALLAALCCGAAAAPAQAGETVRTAILFTHDMHSRLLPTREEDGGEYGGSARLKTAIDRQRETCPDALLVDGGDFSMGTLFQSVYPAAALELRMLGALGYDAATFGNHEYDYRAAGFAAMLSAAADSGDPLPALVEANFLPPAEGEEGDGTDARAVREAFTACGVADYVLIEKGEVLFAVFGLMGQESADYAPMSGMVLHDPADTAWRVVEEATAAALEQYGREPVVGCLSHAGTKDGKGEDYELARAVDGIDVIISAHSHTTLTEPIRVGDTLIVSAGEYGRNLGVLELTVAGDGTVSLADYTLVPIDETLPEDPAAAALVEEYQGVVEEDYLSAFGLEFDQVLVDNPYPFDTVKEVSATQHESTLGDLLADAYLWAAEQAEGTRADVAVTAAGIIRDTVPVGEVTVSDAFNILPLGIGADGMTGYPLVSVYLTGRDLRSVLEVDASVQPLMPEAQLFCAGVEYRFNPHRMIFNRVAEARLRLPDGAAAPIEDDRLYRVVTGLYCGQMLGEVESRSFGLLSVTPRDAGGEPIDMDRLEDYIVRDDQGREVKEWDAVVGYLSAMGGEMDGRYAQPDGRKEVSHSWNPVDLLMNPNRYTLAVVGLVAVIAAAVALLIWRRKRPRLGRTIKRGTGRGYRPYRG